MECLPELMFLEASGVCLVDSAGKIIRETKVASEPDALIEHFTSWACFEADRPGSKAHCSVVV